MLGEASAAFDDEPKVTLKGDERQKASAMAAASLASTRPILVAYRSQQGHAILVSRHYTVSGQNKVPYRRTAYPVTAHPAPREPGGLSSSSDMTRLIQEFASEHVALRSSPLLGDVWRNEPYGALLAAAPVGQDLPKQDGWHEW